MDPKIKAIFEPLRVAIEAQPYVASDLMDLLSSFVDLDPTLARAACLHASDIFQDPQSGKTFAWVIAEIYRRTLFDEAYAKMYGTTELLDRGEETVKQMVEHMLNCLMTDEARVRSMFAPPASAGNH